MKTSVDMAKFVLKKLYLADNVEILKLQDFLEEYIDKHGE